MGTPQSWPRGYPGRVPPSWPGLVPPGRVPLGRVPPPGYPPGVCPMAFWVMLQSIMGYGYPLPRCLPHGILGNVAKHYGIWVPPPVDRQIDGWMDRHVSKHYLLIVLRTRAVKRNTLYHLNSVNYIYFYIRSIKISHNNSLMYTPRATDLIYHALLQLTPLKWTKIIADSFPELI